MVKIGKCTGKEYASDHAPIHECAINVDEKSKLYTELKAMSYPLPECADCRGCPEYINS